MKNDETLLLGPLMLNQLTDVNIFNQIKRYLVQSILKNLLTKILETYQLLY